MIYIFGEYEDSSFVFDDNSLSQADKAMASKVVDSVPDAEELEGYRSILIYNPEKDIVEYIYKPIDED